MVVPLSGILVPSAILAAVLFLAFRLRYFSDGGISGRYPFLFGGILVFIASVAQSVKGLPEYREWFLEGVYPVLDMVQLLLFLAGVFLMIVGLAFYADFWLFRKEEIVTRDQQLSILSNLQRDAREPYQLMELLDIAAKEIVCSFPETAGAIFFVNRTSRQFILTSAVGLTKQETALLEHYPFERNIVSQSVELGEPLVSDAFTFVDRSGGISHSRFNSCLVLPLISGVEKIGGVILLSERRHHFGGTEIKYLRPVAEWLAEKIRSARLARELSLARRDVDSHATRQADMMARLSSLVGSFSSGDVVGSFCRSLVGLVSSQSVRLFGLKNGTLHFYGGSEPLGDLSENYRTALMDALDRNKPLIINQEAVGEEGRSYVARSTLVYPLGGKPGRDALLFARESSPFKLDDSDLKAIDVYSHLALLALEQSFSHRLDITRRRGLEKILQLLRFDRTIRFEDDTGFFVKHLASILPSRSMAVTLVRQASGSFVADGGHQVRTENVRELQILPGEGIVGNVVSGQEAQFISQKSKVAEAIQSFDLPNRDIFYGLFGEKGVPDFLAACPIATAGGVVAVAVIFMFNASEKEKGEWTKLLTLAAGLYSIRLTISSLDASRAVPARQVTDSEFWGSAMNRLNNHLSAVIGNAELASVRADLPGDVENHFRSIVTEAQRAAGYIRNLLGELSARSGTPAGGASESKNLNSVIESVLSTSRISDNLFMVGGRPREINKALDMVEDIEFADEPIRSLFEEALNRFASISHDEDIITVSTYTQQGYVYLDLSRHRRNFPPVEKVSGFGDYQMAGEVLQYRPTDTFLKHVAGDVCYYSFDRFAASPSYLSFRFPTRESEASDTASARSKPRVLAIDDQVVILDLISAMCQTSGYEVRTARSGREGLQLALTEDFDIILADMAMPGLSGLEVAREVRKKKPGVPIVLVTGWGASVDQAQLEASGITRVLYKPFRIEQLVDMVRSLAVERSVS